MGRSCDERDHVWALFLKTYSVLIETLDAELKRERGLPLTWFDVLIQLVDAPRGRLRMNDLSDSLLLSKSGATRLVDRMESAGLIARSSCATDRRVVFATLTPEGRAAFRRAAPVAFRGVEEHFTRHLGAAEKRSMSAAFERVLRAGHVRRGPVRKAV
jgi:DNA-binding MarR family transcriptional regulator